MGRGVRGSSIHDDNDIQSNHEHASDDVRESGASGRASGDSCGLASSQPPTETEEDQRLPDHPEGMGECGEPSETGDVYSSDVDQSESTLLQSLTFQGPIPPPQILAGYKEIDAGYPERIFAMAERSHEAEVAAAHAQTEFQRENTKLVKLGTAVGIWAHAAVTLTCLGIVIGATASQHWAAAGIGAILPLVEGAVRLIQALQGPDRSH